MSLSSAVSKNSKILAIFAISCTAIVGLVNELTKDQIYIQEQNQLLKTFNQVIDPNRYDNNLPLDCVKISDDLLGTSTMQTAYLARNKNAPVAAAITTIAPDGYNGNISLLVAINIDGSISGVRTLKHQETPGLGDKIEIKKNTWITSFADKKLLSNNDSRWAVVKDGGMFDQFTGATITPRAVVKAVKKTVLYFKQHQTMLFNSPNVCQPLSGQKIEDINSDVGGKDEIK